MFSHVLKCVPCSYSRSWFSSYISYVPTQTYMKEYRDSIFFVTNWALLLFTFCWLELSHMATPVCKSQLFSVLLVTMYEVLFWILFVHCLQMEAQREVKRLAQDHTESKLRTGIFIWLSDFIWLIFIPTETEERKERKLRENCRGLSNGSMCHLYQSHVGSCPSPAPVLYWWCVTTDLRTRGIEDISSAFSRCSPQNGHKYQLGSFPFGLWVHCISLSIFKTKWISKVLNICPFMQPFYKYGICGRHYFPAHFLADLELCLESFITVQADITNQLEVTYFWYMTS